MAWPFKGKPIRLKPFDQPSNLPPFPQGFFLTPSLLGLNPSSLSSNGAQPPLSDPVLAHYIQGLRGNKALALGQDLKLYKKYKEEVFSCSLFSFTFLSERSEFAFYREFGVRWRW